MSIGIKVQMLGKTGWLNLQQLAALPHCGAAWGLGFESVIKKSAFNEKIEARV